MDRDEGLDRTITNYPGHQGEFSDVSVRIIEPNLNPLLPMYENWTR